MNPAHTLKSSSANLGAVGLSKIAAQFDIPNLDLLILTGVGSVYPMLRTHTLLSALHPIMGNTPLLMFFPGKYDGHSLRLFNTLAEDHYYRAFRLIPETV